MIILNPLEPWPGTLVLPAAEKYNVNIITRVVDHGGLFHDSLKPGMKLGREDHRSFRPAGWVEAAQPKLEKFCEIARNQNRTLLQLASAWALSYPAVKSVVPTLIQEADPNVKSIEAQLEELAQMTEISPLPQAIANEITRLGDNRNSMSLKGGSSQCLGIPQADQWPLTGELRETARRWGIEPDRDLYYAGDLRDIRETGAPRHSVPQTSEKRLYLQFLAFTNCTKTKPLIQAVEATGIEAVLYLDVNDPRGVGLLAISEDPEFFSSELRGLLTHEPFLSLEPKPELTLMGRSYSSGREADLEDWLLQKPRRNALNPENKWAIWYPLRRKGEFELLSKAEQGKILLEHAMIGRAYGEAGYADDIRLACYGLDKNDNEFVLGVVGSELYPLSRLVQEMRKTQQTSKYMQSLGPFFVGRVLWQSPFKVGQV
jgi:chlorite dismutase